jgi:hypothetical protein
MMAGAEFGFLFDTAHQFAEMAEGRRAEYDPGQALESAAVGAGVGPAFGAAPGLMYPASAAGLGIAGYEASEGHYASAGVDAAAAASPFVLRGLSRQTVDPNHNKALAARDRVLELMDAKLSSGNRNKFSTVVAGVDESTGKVIVKAKNTRTYGDDLCAEDLVVRAFGGKRPGLVMTPAIRPRTKQTVEVCPRCQSKYGPEMFLPGTPPFGGGE